MMKTALVVGLNSQDGSYLAEFLLDKGYRVIGTVRSKNPKYPDDFNLYRLGLEVLQVDLGYPESIRRLFLDLGVVDEVYNLAAQSHVGYSFDNAEETYKVTGVGACMLMDEFFSNYPYGKFYQASSSEMFGNQDVSPFGFDELDIFSPVSPYAVAKTMAHYNALRHQKMGRFACCGILFNHESPRRHESFVTQKICIKAATAKKYAVTPGEKLLTLGNIKARRDWGYAPDYVEIMWKIMQQTSPETFVIGTGKSYSVEQFASAAFDYVGLNWLDYTQCNINSLKRPNDVENLLANPLSANKLLERKPMDMRELVKIMMEHQLSRV